MSVRESQELYFLNALFEMLGQSDDQPFEEVKKELQNEGIDIDATTTHLMEKVEEASLKARKRQLDLAREKRLEEESWTSCIVGKFHNLGKPQLLEKIKQIVDSGSVPVTVSYRELEAKNTDDLRALLEDLEITRLKTENKKRDTS